VEIECTGWNGVKVHCQSQVYEVKKGQKFQTDSRESEIMLDVHETRVIVNWPEKSHLGPISSDEEDLPSPSKRQRAMLRHSTPPSPSPIQVRRKPLSPVSPSPALLPSSPPISNSRQPIVEIYQDPEEENEETNVSAQPTQPTQPTQILSQNLPSFNSIASAEEAGNFSDDNDEENDPIVHSFGPFGANLQDRMAAISASDPLTPGRQVKRPQADQAGVATSPIRPKALSSLQEVDVKSHIINQLAYSRLSSTPLSTIMGNLPRNVGHVSKRELRFLIAETECIGEVAREGKDAAGKPLESEYYYVPEKDTDEFRKEAVVHELRKPGLRACRKQHKVSDCCRYRVVH
jgi:hypothetical protein